MEETLDGLRDGCALPFLDDIIVFSKNFAEHVRHIQTVLRRLKEKGIKLKASKCELFKKEVTYLGRVVSREGYRMDDANIEAVRALKEIKPKKVGEVRQMLGLLGYHRRHIQDFSKLAKPISDLLVVKKKDVSEGDKSKKKNEVPSNKQNTLSSKAEVTWTDEQQDALDKLIDLITSPPILAYPDFEEEFFVHTDASNLGLGCILYQKQEGKDRVIAYGSRTLTAGEQNYHSSKLEFVALKWAVTEKFKDYLGFADHFTVYTDNNPLLYIMDSTKLNSIDERWVSQLSEYNFSIRHRPGAINRDADCLSRLPLDISMYKEKCSKEVGDDAFRAVMAGVDIKGKREESWKVDVNSVTVGEMVEKGEVLSVQTIRKDQEEDKCVGELIRLLKCGGRPGENVEKETQLLYRQKKNLFFDTNGVLRRRGGSSGNQLVVPKVRRMLIYTQLHKEMGHLGPDRVFGLAKNRVYWPKMYSDIKKFINEQCNCLSQKKPHIRHEAPLQTISTSAPMEMVAIGYLKLEKTSGGHEYILLIVDHFTRFAQGYPTKSKSTAAAAKHLYGDFVLRFGLPGKILHDQGGEFGSNLFKELEKFCAITKRRTTPYHPQTNGCVERMNSTLLSMLRTLEEDRKGKWNEYVNKMLHAYNCTTHESTGFSPYFLMFGREPST